MLPYEEIFSGKKITLMGLGLLGRGVGDAKFLAELGADLIVTDLKSETELAASLKELEGSSNITYRLDGHELTDFRERDFILKAAGAPLDSPYIAEARKQGIPIKMSASWFAEIAQIPLVGVTGTRGKSTVVHFLQAIMGAAGMDVLLGGNIRGVSTLALLPQVKKDSLALMELDSWQLQGFGDAGISPQVAVFTTFLPDHQNYYHSMEKYLDDKAQIFLHQKSEDTLVVGEQAAPVIKSEYGSKIISHVVIAETKKFPKGWQVRLPGEHNIFNAMCAVEGARALGIDEAVIKEGIETFRGIPGRLQKMREVNGITIYNDNASTTPEATVAALKALAGNTITLIAGGTAKNKDLDELAKNINLHVSSLVLFSGSGTEQLKPLLKKPYEETDSLQDALEKAIAKTPKGGIVLFSPAFLSFGPFHNYYDRGDQFLKLVEEL